MQWPDIYSTVAKVGDLLIIPTSEAFRDSSMKDFFLNYYFAKSLIGGNYYFPMMFPCYVYHYNVFLFQFGLTRARQTHPSHA